MGCNRESLRGVSAAASAYCSAPLTLQASFISRKSHVLFEKDVFNKGFLMKREAFPFVTARRSVFGGLNLQSNPIHWVSSGFHLIPKRNKHTREVESFLIATQNDFITAERVGCVLWQQ